MHAHLHLFGGFRLETVGRDRMEAAPVEISSRKGRALLAYLASLRGKQASREQLTLLLWSDSDKHKAQQNLRQVLLKLREALAAHGLGVLHSDKRSVRLSSTHLRVDTWEFDALASDGGASALARAADLYTGEFLQDLITDAPVFEDWLADMRTQYQDRVMLCLAGLLESQRKAGHLPSAIATARRALEIDPCCETAHRDLMSLYCATGMVGAALNQYRACQDILRRELDVDPDQATRNLYRFIRQEAAAQDRALSVETVAPGASGGERSVPAATSYEAAGEAQSQEGLREPDPPTLGDLESVPKSPSRRDMLNLICQRAFIAEEAGDPVTALQFLRELERLHRYDRDAFQELTLAYALSRTLCATGELEEGRRYARRTLYLAARSGESSGPWHLAERLLFRLHLFAPRLDDTVACLEARAAQAQDRKAWGAASEILAAQAVLQGLQGGTARMEASFKSAHAMAARLGQGRIIAAPLQAEGLTRAWAGDGEAALGVIDRALSLTAKAGDTIRSCVLRGLRGRAHLALGRIDDAAADLAEAVVLGCDLGHMPYLPVLHAWSAEAALRGGDHKRGLKHVRQAWRLGQARPSAWSRPAILHALALAHAKAKRPNSRGAAWAARQAAEVGRSLGLAPAFAAGADDGAADPGLPC